MSNDDETTPAIPAPNERGPIDPHLADLHARMDAQDIVNQKILQAIGQLTTKPAAAPAASESAAGAFRAPAKAPPAPIAVVEKSPEDAFLDKIVDRLQARLGLAATGVSAPVAEPGGPCNLCDGTGTNAGGVIGCNRCMGTGVMPGRKLS